MTSYPGDIIGMTACRVTDGPGGIEWACTAGLPGAVPLDNAQHQQRRLADISPLPALEPSPYAQMLQNLHCFAQSVLAICSHAGVDPAAAPENWNTKLDPIPEDPATSGLVSLRSTQFGASGGTSSDSKNKPALGLSMVLRQMQLDDYEIKPSEIEMMTKLDGAPAILGRGAFGEVQSPPQLMVWTSGACRCHLIASVCLFSCKAWCRIILMLSNCI